jgi:predicted permease
MSPAENVNADFQWTTPGYFAAMKTELMRGRFLATDDRTATQPVAVINDTLAARYWPGEDAVGRRFRMGTAPERPWITIVGITKTSRHNSITERPRGELYLAHAQLPVTVGGATRGMGLVLRTTGDPLALARPLRDLVHELDPKLPVSQVRPLEDIAAQSMSAPRFAAWLVAAFAAIALMLAAIGAYGTVSLFVAQRTQEIGIRLALGAERRSILRLVLGQGLLLAGVGIALGLTGAAGVSRLLRSWLYGVEAFDTLTFSAVPIVLVLVTLAACAIPARRAALLDPIATLRGQ